MGRFARPARLRRLSGPFSFVGPRWFCEAFDRSRRLSYCLWALRRVGWAISGDCEGNQPEEKKCGRLSCETLPETRCISSVGRCAKATQCATLGTGLTSRGRSNDSTKLPSICRSRANVGSPCSLAIEEIDAPGASAARGSARFCSSVKRRRLPAWAVLNLIASDIGLSFLKVCSRIGGYISALSPSSPSALGRPRWLQEGL